MKQTSIIMGMPITIEVLGRAPRADIASVFAYFERVDRRYSTFKKTSEISRINAGLPKTRWSGEMRWVLGLCDDTTKATGGYFNIEHNGSLDPSGLVKGWAIQNASNILLLRGRRSFYIEAGGDIQAYGQNPVGEPWRVGIRNPFHTDEIIKVVHVDNAAIATSGTYVRGAHIYNPHNSHTPPSGVASLSIVGPTIYDADRFATAAYAMGAKGIAFVERINGLEGYMVADDGIATQTSGFERLVV